MAITFTARYTRIASGCASGALIIATLTLLILLCPAVAAQAQEPSVSIGDHEHRTDSASFLSREASGTAWLPDFTRMSAFHAHIGGWELMLHGNAFGQFLLESGNPHHRSHQAGSINWFMGEGAHQFGNGRLSAHGMFSLEPWTVAGCGYPDLLATGELCQRDTIHDRQHPHDLFMKLAVEYDRPLTQGLRWQLYAGLAGEPALGPPVYLDRPSSFENPAAPISHHWLDSSHVAFGVVTAGLYAHAWKAEASVFNGREPDERRTDLDLAPLDSFSGRVTWLPADRVALQASAGHLHDAEAGVGSLPRQDVNRVTVSAVYHRPFGKRGLWATTVAYGRKSGPSNVPTGVIDQATHAVLLETAVSPTGPQTWFGRLEIVGKPAHDFHADEFIPDIFTVAKLQVGYTHHLKRWHSLVPGIGGSGSASVVSPLLAPRYEGRIAPGFGAFVSLHP